MEDTIEDTMHENNVKNNFFKLIKDKVEQYTVGDLKNDLFDAFIDGARFGDKTFFYLMKILMKNLMKIQQNVIL
jgi:RecJ-like exonuclease